MTDPTDSAHGQYVRALYRIGASESVIEAAAGVHPWPRISLLRPLFTWKNPNRKAQP